MDFSFRAYVVIGIQWIIVYTSDLLNERELGGFSEFISSIVLVGTSRASFPARTSDMARAIAEMEI